MRTDIDQCYKEYILDKLARYAAVIRQLDDVPKDTLSQAIILWDQGLFFEVHEVLEHDWIRASGAEKEILQAMIRAAGVYIKLEYGYTDAAKKIAAKAVPVLTANHDYLATYFDPDRLISALQVPDSPPPLLLNTNPGSAK